MTMTKVDHHLHTSRHSPDSFLDPGDLAARARIAGIDVVVITEHDYQWPDEELTELNCDGAPLVLSGAEVSAIQGHFLVYGLPDLSEAPPGIDLGDLIRVVRKHGAALVAAHPFRWEQDFREIVRTHGAVFDAVELYSSNVTPHTRYRTQELLARHPMPTTGSSDAHAADIVGLYYTELPTPVRSMADFVAGLRSGSCRPGGFGP